MPGRSVPLRTLLCLSLLSLTQPLAAQTIGGAWVDLGPGPANNGQVEGITNREVVGAVNSLAAHPSDANILYAGAVNGGVWKTMNATAAAPTWTRLTDSQRSQSIGAIEFDPTDANRNTLLAGIGRFSSLGGRGGALTGLLRTVDGGTNWTPLDGGGTLAGRTVTGVAPRGATLIVATTSGIYRSTNTGTAFTLLSANGTSGLPNGSSTDLASDPADAARLFAPVIGTSTARGIYRSVDTGALWTKVSDAAVDAAINTGSGATRVEIAVGPSNAVFVAVVVAGRLLEVFRSPDGGATWAALGVPVSTEAGGVQIGAHPGGQGGTHLSIAADPTDSEIVYIGGDRQPYSGEGNGTNVFFPNSLGANDYSGRLFRADAGNPPASRWTPLTHNGTAGNSSPHADSRDMVFAADGNLLESDDGGVYRRTSPRTATGNWFSVNGNLQSTEYHDVSYDRIADRVIGGAQDTGTTEQLQLNSRTFNSVSTGDGGATAVDDNSSTTVSSRYSSFQNLGSLRRRTYNASNVFQSQIFPSLTVTNGAALTPEFYSPIVTNEVNGLRVIIGATNGVYESNDQCTTVVQIASNRINAIAGKPIVYGVPGNAEFLLYAASNVLWLRTTSGAAPASLGSVGGSTLRDVAADPDLPSRLFALSAANVYFSSTGAAPFADVTGNLASFDPGEFRSLAFIPASAGGNDGLALSADRGVFLSFANGGFASWSRLGSGFPNALVSTLDYDRSDDVLIAGTLGRGAWKLSPVLPAASDAVFANGFE